MALEGYGPFSGTTTCLGPGCKVEFRSADKRKYRLCPKCAKKMACIRAPKTISTGGLPKGIDVEGDVEL